MSEENLQLLQQMDQLPFQNLKCLNQYTAVSFKQKNTCHSAIFDTEPYVQSNTDCSFEQAIHAENVQILKSATIKYLEESISEKFNKSEGFKDASLYQELPIEHLINNQCEMLIIYNVLLGEQEKQDFLNILKEREEILGLLKQIPSTFGITVGKEMVYVIYHILKLKLARFKEMEAPKDQILPRFDCFNGFDEQEKAFDSACPIYQDLNLEQIPSFAEKQLDDLCSQLYNSCHIKYLSLKQTRHDLKCSVFPAKFSALIKQISRTVIYTLAGSVEPTQSGSMLFSLDLSRDVSFSDFPEGNIFSIQRSLSRPFVGCEEENLDNLSKKLKFD